MDVMTDMELEFEALTKQGHIDMIMARKGK
jgi:hypothetical protein